MGEDHDYATAYQDAGVIVGPKLTFQLGHSVGADHSRYADKKRPAGARPDPRAAWSDSKAVEYVKLPSKLNTSCESATENAKLTGP